MAKLVINLEANTDPEILNDSITDFTTMESAIRETRAEQVTRVVNEWLMQHNINATYTHKLNTHFLNVNVSEGIVFANAKEEFKYNLVGGDKALQAYYHENMFGILEIIRNAIPSIIAKSITGVQPMTGNTSTIYTLKTQYGK